MIAGVILGGVVGALGGALTELAGVGLTALSLGQITCKINWRDAVDRKGAITKDEWRETLIHELVHVWQGSNSVWSWGYICNSVLHQGKSQLGGQSRNEAYRYTIGSIAGKPTTAFGSLHVEQQAKLIEDARRTPSDNLRWCYVENHIQRRRG